MSEIVDLMVAQGMTAGMVYDYVPEPPWGPPHRCPGCQPRPNCPKLAAHWDKWQKLEARLRAIGETPSCPIVRGEVLPRPYTNEERLARGGLQTSRLPKYVPPIVVVVPQEAPAVANEEAPRKAATKRGPKIPEEQGNLF